MRTLGGIARLLGVDGKTISQYRDAIEALVPDREQRGSRILYRVRAVIEALNEMRRGPGVGGGPATEPFRTVRAFSQVGTGCRTGPCGGR